MCIYIYVFYVCIDVYSGICVDACHSLKAGAPRAPRGGAGAVGMSSASTLKNIMHTHYVYVYIYIYTYIYMYVYVACFCENTGSLETDATGQG